MEQQLVTLTIAGQLCGIPVGLVRDVLGDQAVTHIPLAPPEVAGILNLRGRIVTAIDLRRRLGMALARDDSDRMAAVVEHHGELYALLVDQVTEVISIRAAALEPNPPNLSQAWARVSAGIYPLEARLLVVLDVEALLATGETGASSGTDFSRQSGLGDSDRSP